MRTVFLVFVAGAILTSPTSHAQQGVVNEGERQEVKVLLTKKDWQTMNASWQKLSSIQGHGREFELTEEQRQALLELIPSLGDAVAQSTTSAPPSAIGMTPPSSGWSRAPLADDCDCAKLRDSIEVLKQSLSNLQSQD